MGVEKIPATVQLGATGIETSHLSGGSDVGDTLKDRGKTYNLTLQDVSAGNVEILVENSNAGSMTCAIEAKDMAEKGQSGDDVISSARNKNGAVIDVSSTNTKATNVVSAKEKPDIIGNKAVGSIDVEPNENSSRSTGTGVWIPVNVVDLGSDNGNKAQNNEENEEQWIAAKGKKKISSSKKDNQLMVSPKKNPFMVFSDFKVESRFPINRKKEDEEFERDYAHLSVEEKIIKRQEREM